MASLSLKRFGGMVPLTDPRLLPDEQAEDAVNCDLTSGTLRGFFVPREIQNVGSQYRRAYRFPNIEDTEVLWLGLPSEFSSVVRSPLANDTSRRIYWTNPGDKYPWWNTWEGIKAGTPHYNLGIVQPPDDVALGVSVTGGTSATPAVSRSYTWTYANEYKEESAPALPSEVVSGPPDGIWTVTGLPSEPPPNPEGVNYPPVVEVRLYRTVVGSRTGAQFFLVANWIIDDNGFPPPSFIDGSTETFAVDNFLLVTTDWGNPPEYLDGLTAMPGGMLVGFSGNDVHFCEPNRPHAWPPAYDQSVHHDIVGMAMWQQTLAVLTTGFPSAGSGATPANFTMQQIQASEPCISRGSILTDLTGVFYASQNGLVRMNHDGMSLLSAKLFNGDEWEFDFAAGDIIACRHRSQFVALTGDGVGFAVDFADARLGVVKLSTFAGVTCVWNDPYTGEAYMMANGIVYRWDEPAPDATTAYAGERLVYRWKSKIIVSPFPVNFSAALVTAGRDVEMQGDETPPPLDPADDSLYLPPGVNATFRLFADGRIVHEQHLNQCNHTFRLPSGYVGTDWQCEIVARVPITALEVGTSIKELRKT